jgi:hypothetical protein
MNRQESTPTPGTQSSNARQEQTLALLEQAVEQFDQALTLLMSMENDAEVREFSQLMIDASDAFKQWLQRQSPGDESKEEAELTVQLLERLQRVRNEFMPLYQEFCVWVEHELIRKRGNEH